LTIGISRLINVQLATSGSQVTNTFLMDNFSGVVVNFSAFSKNQILNLSKNNVIGKKSRWIR
jgi:hypothetical protein